MIPGMAALFLGATAVWYGFADPTGGVIQAFRRVMAGEPAARPSGVVKGAKGGGAVGAGVAIQTTAERQAQFLAEVFGTTPADESVSRGGDGGRSPATPKGSSVKINPDGSIEQRDVYGDKLNVPASGVGDAIVREARKYKGTPYVYGGHTKRGFDCAGFTHYVAEAFGVNLAWYVGGQLGNRNAFTSVTRAQLQPGDWVFYGVRHVAIYVGNGTVIHAPKPGTYVREEGNMGNTPGPYAYRRLKVKRGGSST